MTAEDRSVYIARAVGGLVYAAFVAWLIDSALDHAALVARLGDAHAAKATITSTRLASVDPPRWEAEVAWTEEAGVPRTARLLVSGRKFDMVERAAVIEDVFPAPGADRRWIATVSWNEQHVGLRRAEVLLEAANAIEGHLARAAGERLAIMVNRRDPTDIAWGTDRPAPLPFTMLGNPADYVAIALALAAAILVHLLASVNVGPPAPDPELDSIGLDELKRRHGDIEQWILILPLMGFAGAGLAFGITGKGAWLAVFGGLVILGMIGLPTAVTLPFGVRRYREMAYYYGHRQGRVTVWRWLAVVIWATVGAAALAGGLRAL